MVQIPLPAPAIPTGNFMGPQGKCASYPSETTKSQVEEAFYPQKHPQGTAEPDSEPPTSQQHSRHSEVPLRAPSSAPRQQDMDANSLFHAGVSIPLIIGVFSKLDAKVATALGYS